MDFTSMDIEYKVKQTQESVGPLKLKIETLENLDETIDQVFQYLEERGDPQALEELCPYFGVVWPAARALAEFMAELPEELVRGKKILEMGCGLALPSLVVSKREARVLATDFHPEVPRFLQKNIQLNSLGSIEYRQVNWEVANPEFDQFDWVIGSDILYERRFAAPLAKTMSELMRPGGRVVLADPGRPYLQAYVDSMTALGFESLTEIKKVKGPAGLQEVFLLIFSRPGL